MADNLTFTEEDFAPKSQHDFSEDDFKPNEGSLLGKSKDELAQIARNLRIEGRLGRLEGGATDVATGLLSIPGAIGSKVFSIPTTLPKSVSRELIDPGKIKESLDPITEAWGMSGEPVTEAAKEVAAETTASMSSPEAIGTLATGPAAPAIFATEMARGAPTAIQNLEEVSKTGDAKETAKAFMNAALSIGGPLTIARQAGLARETPVAESAQPKVENSETIRSDTGQSQETGQVPVKEVQLRVQPKNQGGIPQEKAPKGLVPAIRLVSGDIVTDLMASTHDGIIEAHGLPKQDIDRLGFVDGKGNFTESKQGSQGVPAPKEEEKVLAPAQTLENVIRDPNQRANNNNSTEAGLAVKSIKDLDALIDLRDRLLKESKDLFEKSKSETDPSKKMDLMNEGALIGVKSQLPREAIEVATNVGGWKEGEGTVPTKLGERPLEHSKNPDVVEWLNKNKRIFSKDVELPKIAEPATKLAPTEQPTAAKAMSLPAGGLKLRPENQLAGERGAINLGIMQDLLDPVKEKADQWLKQRRYTSAPKTMAASEESGNALHRYAASGEAAPYLARAMTDEVLGNHRKDVPFRQTLGAILVEDRLRAIKQGLQKAFASATNPQEKLTLQNQIANVNSMVGQGKFFPDESAFQSALADPEIQSAIDRHKGLVQKAAEMFHGETGGQLAGPGVHTGAFVNLEALHDDVPGLVFSKGGTKGDYSKPFKKRSVFGQRALGSAQKYQLDYDKLAERMIRGNFTEYSKRQMYDQLEKDGLAVLLPTAMARPEIGGKPAVKFQVERRGQSWGGTKIENLWARSDIAPEVRNALNLDGPIRQEALSRIGSVLGKITLAGPTEAVWHSANIFSTIAGSQGGKSYLTDLARKIPGVNVVDAGIRLAQKGRQILQDNPEVNKELSDIALIGATRPSALQSSGVMTRMLHILDRSARLVRNDMYDNLVQRGVIKNPSEAGRREFINQVGQYNPRLMSTMQRIFKEAAISPFVVAGRNFNRLALRKMTLDPGFKADGLAEKAKTRAVEAFGLVATLVAVPTLLNTIVTGNPTGRPGTKFGQIDTGKDDSKGKHIVIDPAQWIGLRRGIRLTGLNAVVNGIQEHKSPSQIKSDAGRDIIGTLIHPWAGPPVQAEEVLRTGKTTSGFQESPNPNDHWQNFQAALKNLNPVAHAFFKKNENTLGGAAENVASSLTSAAGVKTVSPQSAFSDVKNRARSWGEQSSDPKIKFAFEQEEKRQLAESTFTPIRNAIREGNKPAIIKAVKEIIDREPDKEHQRTRMKQILTRFEPFNSEGKLKPFATLSKEMELKFVRSLDAQGKVAYRQAIQEQIESYRKLTEAIYGKARNPPMP